MLRCAAFLLVLLSACTTTRELTPADADAAVIQRLDVDRAWRVLEGEALRGFVVRFADPKLPRRCSYSVRNELQQELGTIDEHGRAWRFVPHQREPDWVATSTLARGAAAILRADGDLKLEPVDVATLRAEAAAR